MKRSMEAEFTEKLHSIAFRATKAECLDLPETTDVVQRVDLEPAALRAYRQLVKDSYARLRPGDQGTVVAVDDIGTVHINWDNGSGLGAAYGADVIRRI